MDIHMEILTALKQVSDEFPDEIKQRIKKYRIIRHNQEGK